MRYAVESPYEKEGMVHLTSPCQVDRSPFYCDDETQSLWTGPLPTRDWTSKSSSGWVNYSRYFAAPAVYANKRWETSPKKRRWTNKAALHHKDTVGGMPGIRSNPVVDYRQQCRTAGRQDLRMQGASKAHIQERPSTANMMDEWWKSLSAILGKDYCKLHSEVIAFSSANELTLEQMQARKQVRKFVKSMVREIWPKANVHIYGSTATGLALPTSDLDIVVVMSEDQNNDGSYLSTVTREWVSKLAVKFEECGHLYESMSTILSAKVPILKLVSLNGIACDISFDLQYDRLWRGVDKIRQFVDTHHALRPLCVVLKVFLKKNKLNEVFTGGVSSFCLTVMIESHLQKLGSEGAVNDFGALLLSFFARYSCMHNYVTDVVSTTGLTLSKQDKGWVTIGDPERLAVESPLDPNSDIAVGSYNFHEVRRKFFKAMTVLIDHWHEENLLDLMLNTSPE